VAELGRGIDELDIDFLLGVVGSLRNKGLAESQDSFLGTNATALDHDVVFVDFTIVREATERSDVLVSEVSRGGGVVLALISQTGESDAVDLLVHLRTMVVAILTGAGDSPSDTGRVPGPNTSNLAETTVSLTRQASNTPASGDTFVTFTLGNTDDVDDFVLVEDSADRDGFLEEAEAEVDFLLDGSPVDLDFFQVGFLLAEFDLADVSVGKDADDRAVFLHTVKLLFHVLTRVVGGFFGVAGKSLFLAAVPVLVEVSFQSFRQVFGPDGGQGTETSRGLDVTHQTDNDHRRGLDDGDSFNNFLLVDLGTGLLGFAQDVGHTSFVAQESRQVSWRRGIVLRERSYFTLVVGASLTGQEPERAMTRCFKLPM